MPMLDRTKKQKIITSSIIMALIVGLVILCLMLVVHSSSLGNARTNGSAKISLGPVPIMQINKHVLPEGGIEGTFEVKSGIYTYGALVLAAGAGLATYRLSRLEAAE